jgi:prepilin-type N-terminal cleavage/methylation domain-containing protein
MKTPTFLAKKTGFTMIELLVVSTIIIVLTTIGLVSYSSASRNGRNAKRKADLEVVRQALVLYRNAEGSYPSGGGSAAAFTTMTTTIDDYLSGNTFTDPVDEDPLQYTYTSDGATFEACAELEEGDDVTTTYCVENP